MGEKDGRLIGIFMFRFLTLTVYLISLYKWMDGQIGRQVDKCECLIKKSAVDPLLLVTVIHLNKIKHPRTKKTTEKKSGHNE